jgi:hypothetical protein
MMVGVAVEVRRGCLSVTWRTRVKLSHVDSCYVLVVSKRHFDKKMRVERTDGPYYC